MSKTAARSNKDVRKKGKMRMTKTERRENLKGWGFISPFILGFSVFTLFPMLFSLYASFTYYDMTSVMKFIGVDNYTRIFTSDRYFGISLSNTFIYVAMSVPAVILMALALALLMNMKIYFANFFRTMYYLPSVLSGVAVVLLWQWIFDGNSGLLNNALGLIGINGPQWLRDPSWTKPALVIMRTWSTGGTMVLFLAALQGVPKELYDAGLMDGATGLRKFWHITLPMISPTMLFVMITLINGAFQIFDAAYIFSGSNFGGPGKSLLFYNLYLYQKGIKELQMGFASALAWVLFVIIMIFTLIQLWVSNKWVHYEGDSN